MTPTYYILGTSSVTPIAFSGVTRAKNITYIYLHVNFGTFCLAGRDQFVQPHGINRSFRTQHKRARVQEVCYCRRGRPWLPVPNSLYGLSLDVKKR